MVSVVGQSQEFDSQSKSAWDRYMGKEANQITGSHCIAQQGIYSILFCAPRIKCDDNVRPCLALCFYIQQCLNNYIRTCTSAHSSLYSDVPHFIPHVSLAVQKSLPNVYICPFSMATEEPAGPQRAYSCACIQGCKGKLWYMSRSTYQRHRKFRELDVRFTAAAKPPTDPTRVAFPDNSAISIVDHPTAVSRDVYITRPLTHSVGLERRGSGSPQANHRPKRGWRNQSGDG